jgi:hypothetical protein
MDELEQKALDDLLAKYGDSGTGLGKSLTKPMEDMIVYLRKIRDILTPEEFEMVAGIMIASLVVTACSSMDESFRVAEIIRKDIMLLDQKIAHGWK